MDRGNLAWVFVLAWAGAVMAGCASGPDGAAVTADVDAEPRSAFIAVAASDYDAAFDAAVRELRDAGFRVARNDRRFGVVTTYPENSPTAFEPWVGHNTTGNLARRSTLNHLRRTIEVRLAPVPTFPLNESLSGSRPTPGAEPEEQDAYTLEVVVTLERRQQPNRYLTHSARSRVTGYYRAVPAHLARDGIPGSYWEPAGSDPQLAEHLLGAIRERTGLTTEFLYDDE